MIIWLLMLHGLLSLPTGFGFVSWHAHESLMGYLSAVFAGFLLTAVPNWTGRRNIAGRTLFALVALWVAGRAAVMFGEGMPEVLVFAVDTAFLLVLALVIVREIVLSKNWRNLAVVFLLAVFIAGNAMYHYEEATGANGAFGYGLRAALAAALMMISVIGGRIVPAFTRNWLKACDSGRALPAEPGRLDALALALTAIALIFWVMRPDEPQTGYVLLAGGFAQLVRLARWRGHVAAGKEPLVWILHIAYAFVPIGLLVSGTAIFWQGDSLNAAAQHLWMAGAIGLMTLAVMTRATLGHTGRKLTADPATTSVYLLVLISAVVRVVAGAVPGYGIELWTVAGVLWCSGFALFIFIYGPMLVEPGKTGSGA